jgi:DhnA family fructose-bisphosphate aldolase class Ia
MISGPDAGIEDIGATLENVIAGGPDAVMVSYGTAVRFSRQLAGVGLVLRMDGGGTVLGPTGGPGAQFYTVEDALRLGADALCVTAFPGTPVEEPTLAVLARVIREAHRWGMPVMAEMVPGGFDGPPEAKTEQSVGVSARVAAELGADWVKVPYVDGFARVVDGCFVPVVVLGGAKQPTASDTLCMLQAALDAGASGATIGRNIWKAPDPTRMAEILARMIHDGVDATTAESLLVQSNRDPR